MMFKTPTISHTHAMSSHLTEMLSPIARLCLLLVSVTVCSLNSGCGYTVGGMHRQEIRTIHVPIFESNSFRRDINLQLTAAVQEEIQKQSHFRLATAENADTRLIGRIIDINKAVTAETKNDDPRQLQYSIAVEVAWEDLTAGRMILQRQLPIDNTSVQILSNGQLAPEVGQSRASAEKNVIHQIARQIVDQLEMPW
jgi:hypothetical protein